MAKFALAVSVAAALVVAAAAGAVAPNDRLIVVPTRIGPFRWLDGWRTDTSSYPAAVRAFGQPSGVRRDYYRASDLYVPRSAGTCHVTWDGAGVTLALFAWSSWWPPEQGDRDAVPIDPCSPASLGGRNSMLLAVRLFGQRWHNRLGVEVASPLPHTRVPWRQRVRLGQKVLDVDLSVELGDARRVRAIRLAIVGYP